MKEFASDVYTEAIKNLDCVSAYNLIQRDPYLIAHECLLDVICDKDGLAHVEKMMGVISDKFPCVREQVICAVREFKKDNEKVKSVVLRVLLCVENPAGGIIEDEVDRRVALRIDNKARNDFKDMQQLMAKKIIRESKKYLTAGEVARKVYLMSSIDGVDIPVDAGYMGYQCEGSGAFVKWIVLNRKSWVGRGARR